eukprot:8540709-Ditylum_brightwellii.AAC.1
MIFHVMSPILFHVFKTPIYQWLQLNKLFMTKTIFNSSKDNAVCIGHLTHLNPIWFDGAQYQDDINELMEALADKEEQKDSKFYGKHNTTKEFAKFQIHLRTGKDYVKENNQQYEYVCQQFAMLSLELLHKTALIIATKRGKRVKESMLTLLHIVEMHPSIYTASKGIWTIETTQENLHKAIKDIKLAIQALPAAVPENYFK